MSQSSSSLELDDVSSSPLEPAQFFRRAVAGLKRERSEEVPVAVPRPSVATVMPPARVTLRRPSRRDLPPSPLVGLLAPAALAATPPTAAVRDGGGAEEEWRDATGSLENWSELLRQLCLPDQRAVLVVECADGTTSLWPRSAGGGGRARARSVQLSLVANGETRWRVKMDDSGGGEAVATVAERKALLHSAISELQEVVCWRAKDCIVALEFGSGPIVTCCGLRDPQIGLWMLDSGDEHVPLDEALRRFGIGRNMHPHAQQLLLWASVQQRLQLSHLAGAFETQEMQLVPVLAHLESTGMLFDVEAAQRYKAEIAHKMELLQRQAGELLGNNRPVNLGSAQQMAAILFDELGLSTSNRKRTTTGARLSVSKETLQELRDQHPLAAMILQFRKLQKLSSTWLDGLVAHVVTLPDAVRHSAAPVPRICSEWLQTSTRTGRLSSANPNFQNLPVRAFSLCLPDHRNGNEMRQVQIAPRDSFVARPGFVLLSCDYAQMEMRILASLANDAKLREFFRGGRDIHREVYAYWKKRPIESVTAEEREIAKRVVYALMYGMGPGALMGVLKCTVSDARTFLSSFLSSFPQVRTWMDQVAAAAERNGYCTTISGRRRLLPADQARHLAVNSIVQGSAADIMKQALIELHRRIVGTEVLLVSTVHDEVVLEVRADLTEQMRATVTSVMENCGPGPAVLWVPLIATSAVGNSLGQLGK